MSVHDISVLVRLGTPEWPGDTAFHCQWPWQISRGASVNVSTITMSPHVGTHADAPLHVLDGRPGSETLALAAFSGPAWVSDVRHCTDRIELADLALPRGEVERLLLKTGRGIAEGAFPESWPTIAPGLVRALAGRGLCLLGVDAPSVDLRESKDLATHHAIFAHGANILENLDLRAIAAGAYTLRAFPLRIEGLDAAPVRAVLEDLPSG